VKWRNFIENRVVGNSKRKNEASPKINNFFTFSKNAFSLFFSSNLKTMSIFHVFSQKYFDFGF
tara:strand:- start:1031 stop:1219 length:189 start_codon:yes stop_codon:yes gene_type:complete